MPGYEAAEQTACEAALAALPPVGLSAVPKCQPIGAALTVEEVAPGVFVHMGLVAEPDAENRGDVANLGFVIGEDSVAVIDAGSAAWVGEALWRAVRAQTDKPVSHLILTHPHPDHVLGAAPFARAGAAVVGHADLSRALADRQENYLESLGRLIGPAEFLGTAVVPVNQEVSTDDQIDLGGRMLHLRAWPTAHTVADLTVLDAATGTLFAGDLVFDRHTPALDGHLRGWQAVLAKMAETPVARIVPGHGAVMLPWPDGLAAIRQYLAVLEADTRAAIDEGLRLGEAVKVIARSQTDLWELFEAYNPRNATVAFTELEWE